MNRSERNRRQRVRRLAKRVGVSFDLAEIIESAQRSIAAYPAWMRRAMYFAGSEAASGHHCEENP